VAGILGRPGRRCAPALRRGAAPGVSGGNLGDGEAAEPNRPPPRRRPRAGARRLRRSRR
jgi:hypothetical protein